MRSSSFSSAQDPLLTLASSLRQVLSLATRSVEKIKSGPRLTATVKMCVLAIDAARLD